MKSLITTVLLLSLVLLLSVANTLYVRHVIQTTESLLESLPTIDSPDCAARAEEIGAYWARQENLLGATIPYSLLDRVCEQASLLGACAKAGDRDGFLHARTLLSDALEDVARAEEFSLSNLF